MIQTYFQVLLRVAERIGEKSQTVKSPSEHLCKVQLQTVSEYQFQMSFTMGLLFLERKKMN